MPDTFDGRNTLSTNKLVYACRAAISDMYMNNRKCKAELANLP